MDYQLFSAPLDKAEYLFFAATFKHRTTFYKIAVAEKFTSLHPSYNGSYSVLLQSVAGTYHYDIHKNESNTWVCDDPTLQEELTFLIGSQIDDIKA